MWIHKILYQRDYQQNKLKYILIIKFINKYAILVKII